MKCHEATGCTLQEKLAFLRDPSHYPGRPGRVTVIETHFACVFLTRHYAYKLKKPMHRGTMDYRTIASRERGCRDEIRLNRRLARSVYLGVTPLSRRRDGRLAIGRGQVVVDWLVRMRRLPASRLLDLAIAADTVAPADLEAVSRVLTRFFRRAQRRPMTAAAYRDRLQNTTQQNARDLRAPDLKLNRARVDAVIRAQREYLRRGAKTLMARGTGLIEGHGDLRPEHVYLGPPACVIDCLEFDSDLRRLDPAEEIAFLVLECTRLGRRDLGEHLLRRYRATMPDPVPDALLQFYMSQSAATRAKILAWHIRDPAYPVRRPWISRANSYLADALRYARAALRSL
jgi:aminoglycoside phosphotransferase family enzyme